MLPLGHPGASVGASVTIIESIRHGKVPDEHGVVTEPVQQAAAPPGRV